VPSFVLKSKFSLPDPKLDISNATPRRERVAAKHDKDPVANRTGNVVTLSHSLPSESPVERASDLVQLAKLIRDERFCPVLRYENAQLVLGVDAPL
jgi:hypothetical protein